MSAPRNIVAAAVCLVGLALVVGCATTTLKQPAYVASFNFTPPETAAPGSAGISFAVVKARYAKDDAPSKEAPFTTLVVNMNADFQELLNARGYTVRGPFDSIEEMTFPDKKGADLALQPTLDLTFGVQYKGTKEKINILTANTYVAHYICTVGGRVTFAVTEPLSGERMWFKSVPVDNISIEAESPVAAGQTAAKIDVSDNAQLAQALDQAYATVLTAAWKYLDPAEMALVKKQSDEIRAKKVY